MIGPDLNVQLLVVRLLAGVIIATVQGAAIAAAAVLLGDAGPRYDGRLTIIPWRHINLVGLLSIALTGFGWGQPMAIEAGKLRLGRLGLVVAVLAGSLALLLTAVILLLLAAPLLKELNFTAGTTAAAFVREAAQLCVWMSLFALVPIPPLAGAHLLTAVGLSVPKEAGTYLGWLLIVATIFGVTQTALAPAYNLIAPLVLGADIAAS